MYFQYLRHIVVVNCEWGNWGTWGTCSKSCGDDGSKQRNRVKTVEEANGGTCDGQPIERKQCSGLAWGTNGCSRKKFLNISLNI